MYLRKGNLKFVITQDNSAKTLHINDFKKAVDERREGDYFGYDEEVLIGRDFRTLLPEDVREIINDNLEFEFEAQDMKDILNHVINFKILTAASQSLDMNVHIEREISTSDKQNFEIVLERKYHLRDKIKSILAGISEVQNAYQEGMNILNLESFEMVLDDVMDYLYEMKLESILMVISVEGFPLIRRNEGKEKTDDIVHDIAGVIKNTFRSRDVPAYIGMGKFAVVMLRTFEDEVLYPIKRLESNLKMADVLRSKMSFNIRYEKLDLRMKARDMLELVRAAQVKYTINSK